VNDFGPDFIARLKTGASIVVPDVTLDPRTNNPAAADAFAKINVRSLINVPLIREGRWVAVLFIHHPAPRDWTSDEVAIVEETAHRLWSAVRQAIAQAALQSSEARLRLFIDRAPAAIAMFDMEMRYLEANRRYLLDYRLEGVTTPQALLGRSHYEVFPEIPRHRRDIHRRVLAGETISADDDPFPRADGRTDWVRWEMAPWYRADGSIGGASLFSEVTTARVEAERALAQSEALLRITQEAGQVGGFVRDMRTGDLTLSDADCLIFGLPPGTGALARDDWFAMLHPEDRARVARAIETLTRSAAPGRKLQYRIIRPDGAIRHIESRTRVERDDTGRALRSLGIHLDVTEQRQLEASLREREELLRAAFEQAAVGIVVRRGDPAFTIGEANEAFCQMTGQTHDEVLAMKVGDVTHPDDIAPQALAWHRLVSGQVNTIEYDKRYLRKDGSICYASVSASRIPAAEGNADCFLTVVHDLTERKRVEDALRESETRFRTVVEATPTLVFSVLPDGQNEFLNQRWADYTGLSAASGAGWGWLDVVHPDDRERNLTEWKCALATSTPFRIERRLRAADGSYRWFLTQAIPVRDQSGRITRWLGSSTDIQDIVNAREVMARGRAELEQLVEQRTRSLQETQTHLAHLQRMEALGQLAGGIAHDFNNVLQAVQGGAGLIERRPTDPESVRRLARLVFEAADRGSSVTRRLLAFARRGDLRFEAVNPVSLLTDMREILTHTLGAGIGVRVNVASDSPALLADKGQLETVLVNLASNARDAMAGRGLLTLGAELDVVADDGKQHAWHVHLKPGAYICLSVSDTGAGMSPEVLARVTEPFFTTKEHGQGTGLGLAMARGFAEQSGGGLRIDSALGQGTTVRIWFPLASPAAAVCPDANRHEASTTGKSARLFVVDDEALVREIITEQLEAAGYAVLSFSSGIDALAALDAGEEAALLVCDLSMPGMDGITLIREAHRRRPKLPAILLTGFPTNAAEIAVGRAVSGMFSLLRKPVTRQILVERVAVLLQGAREGA
jgi:PAS domain S-box-containing protein